MPQTVRAEKLRTARVHIGGLGRIGTHIAIALQEADVGTVSGNDPQMFEQEQLTACGFSRHSDLGRAKAHVVERYFDGRAGFTFLPVVAPNQSKIVLAYLEAADVIVSSANNLDARLHLERAAVRLGKPSIQACAQDARQSLGGLVTRWLPAGGASCFGCLFHGNRQTIRRGEILLPAVTNAVAGIAAHAVVETLLSRESNGSQPNVTLLDLRKLSMETMRVAAVAHCKVCGG